LRAGILFGATLLVSSCGPEEGSPRSGDREAPAEIRDSHARIQQAMNEQLRTELEKIFEADQALRAEAMTTAKTHGRSSPEYESVRQRGLEMDRKHIARLTEIIEQHGWPGRSLVGATASKAAFFVIQHADSTTQRKYLHLVRDASRAGELDRSLPPLLEDRLLMEEGKPQIYGTQIARGENGRPELWPIDDAEHVDERRASVGLEPLSEYLKRFGIQR
jgi:hypothetical protein